MIEQKRSRGGKAALIEQLGGLIVRSQDATQRYDEAVGEIYGLGPAERLALSFLWSGPQTASAIAKHIRLTPAAVTALIDRLEKRGYVTRNADPNDRRKVMIEAAAATWKLADEAYGPMRDAGAKSLGKYSEAQLQVVAEVIAGSIEIQEAMTAALLARHGKS